MILLKRFDANNFKEFIRDFFSEYRKYSLHTFGMSQYPNALCQGYGTSYGKRMVVCDIKEPGLSEFYILNEAANVTQTIYNERPTVESFFVIFRQEISENLKLEFKRRLPNRLGEIVEILDINDLIDKLKDLPKLSKKYENELNSWHEIYRHIGELLNEFYKENSPDCAQKIYDKLEKSDFSILNKNRLFNPELNLKERGLDPVQIFASFNYSRIPNEIRIKNFNIILDVFGSQKSISKNIDFNGIPSPIITSIIQFRGWEIQNDIWRFFNQIYENGFLALDDKIFSELKTWRGIDIPSLTMFLFWINSDAFLPLDQNTVSFLRSLQMVSHRPTYFEEYRDLCHKIKLSGYQDIKSSDSYRAIVKDAYNFSDKEYKGDIISGTTASVVTQFIPDLKIEEGISELQKSSKRKQKEFFNGFKIIALRPKYKDGDKSQKHIKNLREETLYQFYSSYEFEKKDDRIVKYNKEKDIDIYSDEKINISVCSIVGRNGSGKSTITEILYLIINRIAEAIGIGAKDELIKEEVYADLYFKSDLFYKLSIGKEIELFEYEFDDSESCYKRVTAENEAAEHFGKYNAENFCYSLVVNYSLYGLNSKIIGPWINPLFHKNDSYQIPIVINPKRDDGRIDVNIEDELAKSRLLLNVLEPDLIDFEKKYIPEIVDGKIPEKFIFEFDSDKRDKKRETYKKLHGEEVSIENINKLINLLDININVEVEFVEEAKEYIYMKAVSIPYNYQKFGDYKDLPKKITDSIAIADYLINLKNDTSHIAFKFRQAINYLEYNLYHSKKENKVLTLSSNILNKRTANNNGISQRTIDLVAPSFLKATIEIKKSGSFDKLSSGEKQLIYSINTIAYHLYNLKSVMIYEGVLKYSTANIIFDEVELYFHPEMQRLYVSRLLSRIKSLGLNSESGNGLNNINIMFITHSPFILSDIPNSNVLMLKLDEAGKSLPCISEKHTLAGNIHEMLSENFFLSDSIGELAKEKINEILDFHKKIKNSNPLELKENISKYYENYTFYKKVADNVGEDFIKGILNNHLEFIKETLEEI